MKTILTQICILSLQGRFILIQWFMSIKSTPGGNQQSHRKYLLNIFVNIRFSINMIHQYSNKVFESITTIIFKFERIDRSNNIKYLTTCLLILMSVFPVNFENRVSKILPNIWRYWRHIQDKSFVMFYSRCQGICPTGFQS